MVKLNLTLHQSAQISVLLTVEEKDRKDPQTGDPELPKDLHMPADGHHENRVLRPGLSEKKSGKNQILFEMEIPRKLFDALNEDLFQKILVPIQQVLKEGHLDKTEIDEVVLVGGSTRIPRIRQVIQEFFGKDPNTSVDPDLAVVTGVAIQAGIDGGSWPLQVSALEIPNKHLQKTNFN
jgi:stress 70 chaperone-associated protein